MHLSDVDQKGKIWLHGEWLYDFEEIFKMLKEEGFGGNVLVEVYDGNYQSEEQLFRSVQYLKELAYKIF